MLVTAHKREEDWPAPLALDEETVFMMEVFLDKVRPVVTNDKTPSSLIFLMSDGQPFVPGTIGKRISSFTVKSGVRSNTQITATDFRKWIVTTMHTKKQQGEEIDEELLRRLMCHSDKTAKKWYVRQSLTEGAAKAAMQIKENTMQTRKRPAPSETEQDESSEDSLPSTAQEHAAIEDVFESPIKNNQELTKRQLMARMSGNPVLKQCLQSPSLIKKVGDRYRYLRQVEPRINPIELPVEEKQKRTHDFVFSPSVSTKSVGTSSCEERSNDDTATIEEALQPYNDCPRNAEIKELFNATPELRLIFTNNLFDRIKNKVKNLMRKKTKRLRK